MKPQIYKEVLDRADRCSNSYRCLEAGGASCSILQPHVFGEQRFIDRVQNLKQSAQGYSVRVAFNSVRGGSAVRVLPEEGLALFEEMAARELRSSLRQSVYVEVIDANFARAVGTRYSKNKPEGQRYSC
jgi:hypothetical protein